LDVANQLKTILFQLIDSQALSGASNIAAESLHELIKVIAILPGIGNWAQDWYTEIRNRNKWQTDGITILAQAIALLLLGIPENQRGPEIGKFVQVVLESSNVPESALALSVLVCGELGSHGVNFATLDANLTACIINLFERPDISEDLKTVAALALGNVAVGSNME
jgi:hypothetical protein